MSQAATVLLPEAWREAFTGEPVPVWLELFQADADDAVDGLFTGRAYLGHLNVAERDLLLADWVERLRDADGFRERLDAALARWIGKYWGKLDYLRPASLADAWQCAANAVAFAAPHLPGAASELLRHFGNRQSFLGVLSVAPSRDPLGRYLAALAANQRDDTLASYWDWMCDLPQGVPLYHARHALEGVAGLPTESSERCSIIGTALLRLGRALLRHVRAEIVEEKEAERDWKHLAYWCLTAFPFAARWRDFAAREVERLIDPLPTPLSRWSREVFAIAEAPVQAMSRRIPKPNAGWVPVQEWVQRAKAIRRRFRHEFEKALSAADQLLDEQRRQPDPHFLVRSLCNFAMRVVRDSPKQALTWAEEAHQADPSNPYAWTTLAEVQLATGQRADAEATALEAWNRFARNAVVATTYAKVLHKVGKSEEAVPVYRSCIQHFPDDVVARSGLADVLKHLDRLEEAEAVYRETIELFPHDPVARNGLGDVLKHLERFDEAGTVYREVLELFAEDRRQAGVAHNGLAGVLRRVGRHVEALEHVDEALRIDPGDRFALAEHDRILATQKQPEIAPRVRAFAQSRTVSELVPGRLSTTKRRVLLNRVVSLRQWAQAGQDSEIDPGQAADLQRQATELVEAILQQSPEDERALVQRALLHVDAGELDAAQRKVEQALRVRPNAQLLLALQARVDRLRAKRDQERLLQDVEPRVLEAPHRLRRLRPELRPVLLLQQGLGYLALTDGELRKEKATEEFKKLDRWIQHRGSADGGSTDGDANEAEEEGSYTGRESGTDADFNRWWAGALKRKIFEPVLGSEPPKPERIADLAAVLEEEASFVEKMEECFVGRLAARAEWDPTAPLTS